ncbi:MAG TPA: Uma2 family endonuclease, partial [Thermoanaerobaculia bacterium]|nr:Uma2 family endonuclease [Thermoanaerobaculia bacterium]
MAEQGRTDFYIGINMFLYYSVEQARDVAEEEKGGRPCLAYRGPDFYWIGGVDPSRNRPGWVAWEEDGRLPNVILELLSPFTAHKDRTERKDLYEQVLRTDEYFMYEPETRRLEGLRLASSSYRPIPPDGQGRLWSEQLKVSLGLWHGVVEGRRSDWVRLFRPDGSLLPTN